MEFTKPKRNSKHPTGLEAKHAGRIRNRTSALQMIPPEQGMKPSDRISNFHRNGIAEAWFYSCSRILETKGKEKQSKVKQNKNAVQQSRRGIEN